MFVYFLFGEMGCAQADVFVSVAAAQGCGQGEDRATHRPPDHLSPGEEIAFDGAALRLPHGLWAQRGEHGLRASPRDPG